MRFLWDTQPRICLRCVIKMESIEKFWVAMSISAIRYKLTMGGQAPQGIGDPPRVRHCTVRYILITREVAFIKVKMCVWVETESSTTSRIRCTPHILYLYLNVFSRSQLYTLVFTRIAMYRLGYFPLLNLQVLCSYGIESVII